MNFNVYLDDETARRLDAFVRASGTTRNAVVRAAVTAWLDREGRGWPEVVRSFAGDPEWTPFESSRADLDPREHDPFATTGDERRRPRGSRRRG